MTQCYIPQGYKSALDVRETETAIKFVKDTFERTFSKAMQLLRISAPLFVTRDSGLNDNLNGVERPVSFSVRDVNGDVEIVHSLAKWKRMALKLYGFLPHEGLYTDMNAIRRDEEPDNLHSIYVDQWDWEKVILPEDRTVEYLKNTVKVIVRAMAATELATTAMYPRLTPCICPDVFFITSQELEDMYPNLSPKQRENEIARKHRTVFVMQIGGALKGGKPHDGRAPDYDDWALNGDILFYFDTLDIALEVSSMGIRVDEEALARQLEIAGEKQRAVLPFQKALLNGELPYTIGGGIGQSRICMFFLKKAHIGEVQASEWPQDVQAVCEENGICLL